MKLFLLRHAKSAWRSFENDHDRALSERGLRDAKTLAEHISNSQISFSKILCSTAKRTKETLKLLKKIHHMLLRILIIQRIYIMLLNQ